MSSTTLPPTALSLPGIKSAPLTWTLGLVSLVLAVSPGLSNLLQYDALAIAGGEVWRACTGHLAHWDGEHLLWDLSAFLVLGTLCEWHSRRNTLRCILGTATATSLYMFLALPEIPTYRGLSGIDTGLFTLLSLRLYAEARCSGDRTMPWVIVGLAMGLLAKLSYEVLTGGILFVDAQQANFIPIVGAHILGAITGVVVGLWGEKR